RGYFEAFCTELHTKSQENWPFDWIWCEVPSFRGWTGVARPSTPTNPSQAMGMENGLFRVVPRPNPGELINAL
ncbi:hypothetical protein ACQX0B_10255, partial [Corynebacterium diphtheriae]